MPQGPAPVLSRNTLAVSVKPLMDKTRAAVPLIAGIFEMPYWRFQLANFTSAFVWAATLLTIGDGISTVAKYFWG
jgi:membrane protein DedA with SNARE-associated domain